jgi:hypothetical protein
MPHSGRTTEHILLQHHTLIILLLRLMLLLRQIANTLLIQPQYILASWIHQQILLLPLIPLPSRPYLLKLLKGLRKSMKIEVVLHQIVHIGCVHLVMRADVLHALGP